MTITTATLIRQLAWEKSDLDQIMEIEWASFNRYDAYTLADFERWFHYNPDLCLAAEVEGRIAGYVISRIQSGYGDLASLAIGSAYRRWGIGSALLAESVERIKNYGVDEIHLEVRKSNRTGLAFWQNMGFIPFGRLPNFYEDGEEATQMKKVLAESREKIKSSAEMVA